MAKINLIGLIPLLLLLELQGLGKISVSQDTNFDAEIRAGHGSFVAEAKNDVLEERCFVVFS